MLQSCWLVVLFSPDNARSNSTTCYQPFLTRHVLKLVKKCSSTKTDSKCDPSFHAIVRTHITQRPDATCRSNWPEPEKKNLTVALQIQRVHPLKLGRVSTFHPENSRKWPFQPKSNCLSKARLLDQVEQ